MAATISLASFMAIIVGGLALALFALHMIEPSYAHSKQLEALMLADTRQPDPKADATARTPTGRPELRGRTRFPKFLHELVASRTR